MKTSDKYQEQFHKRLFEEYRPQRDESLGKIAKIIAEHGESYSVLASEYRNLGFIYQMLMEFQAAEEVYEKALSIDLERYGEDSEQVYRDIMGLAHSLEVHGNSGRKIETYLRALSVAEKVFGKEEFRVVDLYNNLGQAYYRIEKYEEAERWHLQSLDARKKMFPPGDLNISTAHYGLAKTYIRIKRFAEARKHIEICDRNEEMCEQRSYLGWTLVVDIWAEYYRAIGNCEQAVKCYSDLIASWNGPQMGTSEEYFDVYSKIAGCYEEAGDEAKAEKYKEVALMYKKTEH